MFLWVANYLKTLLFVFKRLVALVSTYSTLQEVILIFWLEILGTNPVDIDKAEDRQKFSEILDSIGVDQPAWKELTSVAAAEAFADHVSYPVLVRPSYVLSGAAMTVIRSKDELKDKLEAASNVSPDHPVVITKFIEGAQEIDVDAVASNGQLIIHAVSEHVEQAGVHSGDATLVLPPASLDQKTMDRVKEIAVKVAQAWKITGPFNMQIIKADDPDGGLSQLKVIEVSYTELLVSMLPY